MSEMVRYDKYIILTLDEAIEALKKMAMQMPSEEPELKCTFKVGDEVKHQQRGEIAYVLIPEDEHGNLVLLMKGYRCPQLTPAYHWEKTGHSNSTIRGMIRDAKKAMDDENCLKEESDEN